MTLAAPLVALLIATPLARPSEPRAPAAAAPQHRKSDTELRPGPWKKDEAPAGWLIVESPGHDYQLQAQIPEAQARALAEYLQAMLALYEQLLPRPRAGLDRLVIKLFAQRQDFLAYGSTDEREPHSADRDAWFDPTSGDVVACDTGLVLGAQTLPTGICLMPDRAVALPHGDGQRLRQLFEEVGRVWTPDTAALLAREGWRQYLAAATPSDVAAPPWLEAGLADCFAAATTEASVLGRRTCRLGALNADRLRAVRRAVLDGSAMSLRSLLGLSPAAFDAPTGRDARDAQSWALVQFLLDQSDARLAQLPRTVLAGWMKSKNADEAVRSALQDLDPDALQRQWLAWIDDQAVADPLADLAREFGKRIAPIDLQTDPRWRAVYHWHQLHPPAGAPDDASPADAPAHRGPP